MYQLFPHLPLQREDPPICRLLHFRCQHLNQRKKTLLAIEVSQEDRYIFLVVAFENGLKLERAFDLNVQLLNGQEITWADGKPLVWPFVPAIITVETKQLACGAPYLICPYCSANFPLDKLHAGFNNHLLNSHTTESALIGRTAPGSGARLRSDWQTPYYLTQSELIEKCVRAHLNYLFRNVDSVKKYKRLRLFCIFVDSDEPNSPSLRICPYCGCQLFGEGFGEHFFRLHAVYALRRPVHVSEASGVPP